MRTNALCLLALGVACTTATPPDAPVDPDQNPGRIVTPAPIPPTAANEVDGTVEFVELEGGCWAIKVGDVYNQPTNLSSEFQQDGLAVRVRLERQENMASICMIGPIVRVVSIRLR
jgi:hypothetical protein